MKYLLCIFLSFSLFAYDRQDQSEYIITDTVKVGWDASEGGEFYEIKLVWIDVEPNVEYNLGRTSELQMEISFERSGHFKVMVRAGAWDIENEEEIFSEWADSSNELYATVDGEHKGWVIRKILEAPTWD